MVKATLSTVSIIAIIVISMASQSQALTKCSDVPTAKDFNVTKYLGDWYEIATSRLVRDTIERDCLCTRAQYSATSTPGLISVHNTCHKKTIDGPMNSIYGNATQYDKSDPARLHVEFFAGRPGPYWVSYINSNYTAAVIVSCEEILGFVGEAVWILSKYPELPAAEVEDLKAILKANSGYNPEHLHMTVQDGCWQ